MNPNGTTLTITNDIEKETQTLQVVRQSVSGDVTSLVFKDASGSQRTLTYKNDNKGSNGMSDTVYPYSGVLQTQDHGKLHGGCYTKTKRPVDSVLDCKNLGDAIEARVCESSLAIECEDSARSIVLGIQSIRSGKTAVHVKTTELVQGKKYSVEYKIPGENKTQVNLVNTIQARHGSSCAAASVEQQQ